MDAQASSSSCLHDQQCIMLPHSFEVEFQKRQAYRAWLPYYSLVVSCFALCTRT